MTGAVAGFAFRLTTFAAGLVTFGNAGFTGLAVGASASGLAFGLATFAAGLVAAGFAGLIASGTTFGATGLVAGLAHHGAGGSVSFVELHIHLKILLLKFGAVTVSLVLSIDSEDNSFDDEERNNYGRPNVADSLEAVHPDLAVPTAGLEH
jgi:hypothetical protein